MSDTPQSGWYPDPLGRHEQRYWDGTQWAEHVADGGVTGVDPVDGPGPTAADPTEAYTAGQPEAYAAPAASPFDAPPQDPAAGGTEPFGAAATTDPVGDSSGPNWGIIAIVAAIVAVLIGALIFFVVQSDDDDSPSPTSMTTRPDDTTPSPTTSPPSATTAAPGGGGALPPPTDPATAIAEYGSDATLDGLASDCAVGDMAACDDLFRQSESGSGYEDYGADCGGRTETNEWCEDFYG